MAIFIVFNVTVLAGHLFLTYAKFDVAGDEGQEQVNGAGLGHVVEYNEDGSLALDFHDGANTPGGVLNEPWGVAIAPATFGIYGGDMLVANFGDGTISAFDRLAATYLGNLKDSSGTDFAIDGLWMLAFGNGVTLGDANSLYFTAGPEGEKDGLFGKLTVTPTPEPGTAAMLFGGTSLLLNFRQRKRQMVGQFIKA